MSLPNLPARWKKFRPVVDGLESRESLNASPMVAAQVSMMSGQETSGGAIVTQLPTAPLTTVSTIPANGDLNPYGVAFVPRGFQGDGALKPGDVLVLDPSTTPVTCRAPARPSSKSRRTANSISLTYRSSDLGLTTALGVLKGGFVLVGNTPMTTVGGTPTVQQGSLLILDRNGKPVETLTDSKLFDGPWT